jgi:hypothetical protein
MKTFLILSFALILLAACTPQSSTPPLIVTAIPTATTAEICELPFQQSADWQLVIQRLQHLKDTGQTCSGASLELRLYYAWLHYGAALDSNQQATAAQEAYQQALTYQPDGIEAQRRLAQFLPTSVPAVAIEQCAEPQQDLPAYQPSSESFVRMEQGNFLVENAPFRIYGVNYYPQKSPFQYFLRETTAAEIEMELALIADSGINTLRIFLPYPNLFACSGTSSIPVAHAFELLDTLLQVSTEYGFRMIIVLHQDSDPAALYNGNPITYQQTSFIVQRYREEPAILAWDLRDQGDRDYREHGYSQQTVLRWLGETAIQIRSLDDNHLLTASWLEDATSTQEMVDFVSFQFYGEYPEFRQQLASLRAQSRKPILLTSIGYSTFEMDETIQRNYLYQAFEEAQYNQLLGWIVYMAFDYPRTVTCTPPDCPGSGAPINHFGLWNTSYFPKLAVDAVETMTGITQP